MSFRSHLLSQQTSSLIAKAQDYAIHNYKISEARANPLKLLSGKTNLRFFALVLVGISLIIGGYLILKRKYLSTATNKSHSLLINLESGARHRVKLTQKKICDKNKEETYLFAENDISKEIVREFAKSKGFKTDDHDQVLVGHVGNDIVLGSHIDIYIPEIQQICHVPLNLELFEFEYKKCLDEAKEITEVLFSGPDGMNGKSYEDILRHKFNNMCIDIYRNIKELMVKK